MTDVSMHTSLVFYHINPTQLAYQQSTYQINVQKAMAKFGQNEAFYQSRDDFLAQYDESKVGEKDLKTPPTCWDLFNQLFQCSAPLYQSGQYYRYGKFDNCLKYYAEWGKCCAAKLKPDDNAFKRHYDNKEVDYSIWEIWILLIQIF
eukprot:TRINITY_DN25223_c0_g2_i2.p1 TRINITY_DN25223_c0_g2~~TRINITY_DN25223_c0_g2_i2.p1  ORF type:complete len:147 (-),score=8.80 TRINITY_DN25223_c0_g2_i2:87-527(-)